MKDMLKCGHAANSKDRDGNPSCVICAPFNGGSNAIVETPDLHGRFAQCGCKRTTASSTELAFFEFCGDGSRSAVDTCKHCRYAERAHHPEVMAKNNALRCANFEPHGTFEFDRYYCGCRGWE